MFTQVRNVLPALTALTCVLQLSVPAFGQYSGSGYNGYTPYANANYTTPNYTTPQQPYRGHVVYVPAGMVLNVTLNTSISTDTARPGDVVQATLNQPVYLGNTVIPQGSTIIGNITEANSGGFFGRAGMLGIKFNRFRTPNGIETPMTAHIVGGIGKYAEMGGDYSDTVKGETWKTKTGQAAIRGAVGAGTGAALGTAIGAIAGGRRGLGRGAWSGAAIGGGLGVAQSLVLRKGKNVLLSSGAPMQLQLDAPMQLSTVTTGAF